MIKSNSVINLLPREEYGYRKKQRIFQLINLVLFIIVISLGLVAAFVWSITLVVGRQITAEEQKIASLQQRLSTLSAKEQKLQLLSNRLMSGVKILASRSPLDERLSNLKSKLPQGVLILAVAVNEGAGSIDLTVESNTYAGFGNLLPVLAGSGFSFVKIDGITRAEDGVYTVILEVKLT